MFQYKNQMAIQEADRKQQLDNLYYDRQHSIPSQLRNELLLQGLGGSGGGGGYHGRNTTKKDRAKKQAQIWKEKDSDEVTLVSKIGPYSEKGMIGQVNQGKAVTQEVGKNRIEVQKMPRKNPQPGYAALKVPTYREKGR